MLPTNRIPASVLLVLAVALTGGRAAGQTTATYWTLEARIAQADAVVLGTLSRVARRVIVPPGGASPDGTVWPDGIDEVTVTIKVDEVLKGKVGDACEFTRTTTAYNRTYDGWLKACTPFLWFLTREKERVAGANGIRLGKAVEAESGYRTGYEPPLFSMDLAVLREADDILKHARLYARTCTKVLPTHTITLPRGVAQRCTPSGDANFLIAPRDASLERLAKRLISSPEGFVPQGEQFDSLLRYQLRIGGVAALGHFQSDGNAALLRALLDDPTEVFQKSGSGTVKRYPIRAAAYGILQTWGVRVPMPVVEVPEPAEKKRD
jgi:hypothetical protein